MKKHILGFFGLLWLVSGVFLLPSATQAETQVSKKVLIEVFERKDCAHCQAEQAFLNDVIIPRSEAVVRFIDIDTEKGRELFNQFTEHEKLPKATPITVVGVSIVQGFDAADTTGKKIENLIEKYHGLPEAGVSGILAGSKSEIDTLKGALCGSGLGEKCLSSEGGFIVRVPFTGRTVDTREYSLPVLAALLGLIDGFNPCAMWVLVTFLLVLVQMGDRRRMWTVAGLFIVAETVMYYLILNVWFTTWDFIGLDRIVTPIVGFISIGGGFFFLYEWYTSEGTCKVVGSTERVRITGRIKKLATEPFTWLTAIGVIGLAFSVNIIEFACSIGIPQAFTKIIELNRLSFWQTQGLMSDYIFFYMIDDFLVFGLALWGFDKLYLTQKYSKWSNLIGGILMFLLGLLLVFSPQSLRF